MAVVLQQERGILINLVSLGEKADDLQAFVPKQFAQAMFGQE